MRTNIPKNTVKRKQRYVLAFDTETTQEEWGNSEYRLTWKCGAAWYTDRKTGEERKIETFHRVQFVRFILSCVPKRGTLYVYAHNIWFDFKVVGLHRILPRLGWILDWFYFSEAGGNAIITFRRGTRRIKFINSYNYYPLSVKSIGDSINLPKLEVDFNETTDEQLISYCSRDAEIVFRAILKYFETVEQLFNVRAEYTAGSTAYQAWVNMDNGGGLEFHDDPDLASWERNAYKGGRCEAFQIGKLRGAHTCFDVNSMYPFVMLNFPMPLRIVKVWGVKPQYERIDARDWRRQLARFVVEQDDALTLLRTGEPAGVMADCTVTVNEPAIGIMHKGKLIFPVGTFRVTLACCEFEYAMRHGWVKQVHSAELWAMGYPFKKTIGTIWDLRHALKSNANHDMATVVKLLGNSLYGKFGQRKLTEDHREPCPLDNIRSEMWIDEKGSGVIWELCGQRVYVLKTKEPTKKTHFPLAAEITARARLVLWDYILKAEYEHVAYCDTDSVIADSVGADRLGEFCGDALGALKREWTDTSVAIHGLKDYSTSTKVKHKGISDKAEFVAHLKAWKQTQFVGIRGDLQRSNAEGIIIRNVTKHLSRQYGKGIVRSDGRVIPYRYEKLTA